MRRERNEQGITQEHLAELVEFSLRNMQRVEVSAINVLMTTVTRIRRALGCSADKLIPLE